MSNSPSASKLLRRTLGLRTSAIRASMLCIAGKGIGYFFTANEFHERQMFVGKGEQFRHQNLLVPTVIFSSANKVVLFLDRFDFVGEALLNLLKHLNQGNRTQLIKIV